MIFDVLYSRKGTCLVDYFKSLDQYKRMKVQYFSCDMNKTFIDLARIYFPNAKIVIDRYHFVRQVYWALENVRKRIQKRMLPPHIIKCFLLKIQGFLTLSVSVNKPEL